MSRNARHCDSGALVSEYPPLLHRIPASVLPIFDRAEQKMRDLVERLRNGKDEVASKPAPAQDFPEAVSQSFHRVLASAPGATAPNSTDIKVDHAKPLKVFVPECFPGPARREDKLGANAFGLGGVEETAETHHLLTPLTNAAAGDETEGKWVYRVATIAGLWQIRGLDPEIDQALNIIWEGVPSLNRPCALISCADLVRPQPGRSFRTRLSRCPKSRPTRRARAAEPCRPSCKSKTRRLTT